MIHLCNSEEKKERERERIMSVINSADKVTKSDFQSLIDQLIYLISKLLIIKLMFSPEHYFSFSSTCVPFKDKDLTIATSHNLFDVCLDMWSVSHTYILPNQHRDDNCSSTNHSNGYVQ